MCDSESSLFNPRAAAACELVGTSANALGRNGRESGVGAFGIRASFAGETVRMVVREYRSWLPVEHDKATTHERGQELRALYVLRESMEIFSRCNSGGTLCRNLIGVQL